MTSRIFNPYHDMVQHKRNNDDLYHVCNADFWFVYPGKVFIHKGIQC